jgi:hypothetical protein
LAPPQDGQVVTVNGWPQRPQNRKPSGLAESQAEQTGTLTIIAQHDQH